MKPPAPRTRPGVSLFRWCGCVVVGEHHWNSTHTRCLYCGRKTTA